MYTDVVVGGVGTGVAAAGLRGLAAHAAPKAFTQVSRSRGKARYRRVSPCIAQENSQVEHGKRQ